MHVGVYVCNVPLLVFISLSGSSWAGDAISETQAPGAVTLMQMFQWGGVILWLMLALAVLALAWAFYCFFTVTVRREAPSNFTKRVITHLSKSDVKGALQMCEDRDELLVRVIRAGLRKTSHEWYVIKDAAESAGERGASRLWLKVSHLRSVGHIAALLGLLGTTWSMLQAFNGVAAENAHVRELAMAAAISKAMVTMTAGLCIATGAVTIYYYLRGRVIRIVAEVQAQAGEVLEMITQVKDKG